jgi:hypothetical protein
MSVDTGNFRSPQDFIVLSSGFNRAGRRWLIFVEIA